MGAIKRRTGRTPAGGGAASPAAGAPGPLTFTARLVALDERGRAWVQSPSVAGSGARTPAQAARSTVALGAAHVGREVLVCRANLEGELVIVGVLVEPRPVGADAGAEGDAGGAADPTLDLVIERRRVVLSARTEVVLRCGEGSITLAANGKVTISGVDVVSSAARTQRIRGGAVRIN